MSDSQRTEYSQGDVIFRQGDEGGDLIFVKSGMVKLTLMDPIGRREINIATVGKDGIIGAMSFLGSEPRSATATAMNDVKIVRVDQKQKDNLMKTVPTWFQALLKDMADGMRKLNKEYIKVTRKLEILEGEKGS